MDMTGILLILIQILAVSVGAYLLLLERKYCKHCHWWSDTCAFIVFVIDLIPVTGIFTAIAGCADAASNIARELDNLKGEKDVRY